MDINGIYEEEEPILETERQTQRITILGLALVAILSLGYTLAANINLSTNSSVEFGQGVQALSTCDERIVVKPNVEFRNDVSPPGFYLSKFDISDVSADCIGKEFVLSAYDETGTVVNLKPTFPRRSLRFHFDASGWKRDADGCWWLNPQSAVHLDAVNNSVQVGTCGVGLFNHKIDTLSKMRFTIETYERTTSAITITFPTSLNVGYFLSYKSQGETYGTGWPDGLVSDRVFYPNPSDWPRAALFIRLSDADYTNASISGSSRQISRSSGLNCIYVGKIDMHIGEIQSGPNLGLLGPPFRGLEYSCLINSDDTISIQ